MTRQAPGRTESVESIAGNLGELRSIHGTAGGVALSTTITRLVFPPKTSFLQLITGAFSTAVAAQIALLPYITVLKTTDNGATFTDYSDEAQDGNASSDLVFSALATAALGDYIYIGSHRKTGGVFADVDAANGDASVMTAEYWNGSAWAALSITDGTASGGAALAQDGTIAWTPPANWQTSRINNRKLYWVRLKFSIALDAAVTLNSLLAIPASTAYWEMRATQVQEMQIDFGPEGWAGIQAKTDAGTSVLIANVASGPNRHF